MSRKKKSFRKRDGRRAGIPRLRLDRELSKTGTLLEQGRPEEARELLEGLRKQHPDDKRLLLPLLEASSQLKDWRSIQEVGRRVLELDPDIPEANFTLALAYGNNLFPASAAETLRTFLENWPQDPLAPEAREILADLEARLSEIIAESTAQYPQLSAGERFELALRHEEVQILLNIGRYEEAYAGAVSLLQMRSDFVPALNNLSLLQWILGNPEEAIETAGIVLSLEGKNVHGLANLIRFLAGEGKKKEAVEYGRRLKGIHPASFLQRYKKMEGLAFLGDDRGVMEVFEKSRPESAFNEGWHAALFHRLAATAYCRLGKLRMARRYWKKALSYHPSLVPARQNLEDLEKPPGERNGPWYFDLQDWLPLRLFQRFTSLADEAQVGRREVRRRIAEFLGRHPVAVRVMIPLAEMGDPFGREYCLRLAEFVEDEQVLARLKDFALGPKGTDQVRLEMVRVLQKKGVIPPGLVRMWERGEPLEVLTAEIEIYTDAESDAGTKVQRLVNKGVPLLRRGQAARAEEIFRQALVLEPDQPTVLQNLAVSIGMQGRGEEARKLFYQIHEKHPDYLFARTSVAMDQAKEGNLEKARELVWPIFQRKRFHRSEFATVCGTMAQILALEGKLEGARHWIALLKRLDPGNPGIPRVEAMLPR